MSDSSPNPPEKRPRRVRYSGKNPRHFSQKYKELAPEQYPDDVSKILASGKTPAGSHRPILLAEILNILNPQPGEIAVDCTLGYGGHARQVLERIQPGGKLIGIDVDPIELPRTEARLRELGYPDASLFIQRSNFAGIQKCLATCAPDGADLILADLGVSSMQIDNPERGFTFKVDGPLDMRMNPARGISASELLSKLDATSLAALLEQNADEPRPRAFANAILTAHSQTPLTTTRELAEIVRTAAIPFAHGEIEEIEMAVRRVFQALRIAVNDEFGALDSLLRVLPYCLKPRGRLAILTFHSGEDRRVKQHLKEGMRLGYYSHFNQEVIQAGPIERRENPRSTSAKLRYAVRSELPISF